MQLVKLNNRLHKLATNVDMKSESEIIILSNNLNDPNIFNQNIKKNPKQSKQTTVDKTTNKPKHSKLFLSVFKHWNIIVNRTNDICKQSKCISANKKSLSFILQE